MTSTAEEHKNASSFNRRVILETMLETIKEEAQSKLDKLRKQKDLQIKSVILRLKAEVNRFKSEELAMPVGKYLRKRTQIEEIPPHVPCTPKYKKIANEGSLLATISNKGVLEIPLTCSKTQDLFQIDLDMSPKLEEQFALLDDFSKVEVKQKLEDMQRKIQKVLEKVR